MYICVSVRFNNSYLHLQNHHPESQDLEVYWQGIKTRSMCKESQCLILQVLSGTQLNARKWALLKNVSQSIPASNVISLSFPVTCIYGKTCTCTCSCLWSTCHRYASPYFGLHTSSILQLPKKLHIKRNNPDWPSSPNQIPCGRTIQLLISDL